MVRRLLFLRIKRQKVEYLYLVKVRWQMFLGHFMDLQYVVMMPMLVLVLVLVPLRQAHQEVYPVGNPEEDSITPRVKIKIHSVVALSVTDAGICNTLYTLFFIRVVNRRRRCCRC